jgi:predicted nuclease of predicted toxin-antitoxin system
VKLLVDMNLSPAWAAFLSQSGIPATHWSEVGARDATDEELMRYAVAHGFVVLTHDLDFAAILAAAGDKKPSVVQIRSDNLSPNLVGDALVRALRAAESQLDEGALISVRPGYTRLHVLPLKRPD